MSTRRIFVVNAHPGGNIGAEGMLSVVVSCLQAWPEFRHGAEIWLETIGESPDYELFARRHGLAANFFRFEPRRIGSPYRMEAGSDDVMVDIGGIAYHDGSVIANLRNYRRHRFFASRGMRMVFFTQDFGPARKLTTRILARSALSTAQAVFARSTASIEFLKETVPSINAMGPYPDCTLALVPAVLPEPVIPAGYIVIVPSAIMWNTHGEHYLELLKDIVIATPSDRTVVVMSHNFTPNDGASDSEVCAVLLERLGGRRETILHDRKAPATELKSVLAGADAVVTSRYHALVGAMTSGTPACAIGWSHKYSEFLNLYGMGDRAICMEDVPQDRAGREALATGIFEMLLTDGERKRIAKTNLTLLAAVETSLAELRRLISV